MLKQSCKAGREVFCLLCRDQRTRSRVFNLKGERK